MSRNRVILLFVAALLALGASECDTADQQQDSQREIRVADGMDELGPAFVVEPDTITIYLNVDGFRNVSRMCIDGNGVYVTSRGGDITTRGTGSGGSGVSVTSGSLPSSIAVVPDDRGCQP